ncbi:efflux RND transporter periplasmic adaptor subunit [Sphingomonas fennica]|nr:HlyD family efflux transporter periplasmic adaptor subunit [Sphingomonas fennica]
MAHIPERLKRMDRRSLGWLVVAAGGLFVLALWWRSPGQPEAGGETTEQTMVVQPRPFTASISFAGTIKAGEGTGIVAPFDGTVKEMGFAYGNPVAPGQMLAVLDVSELEQSRNEAESAYLKAMQAARDMEGWASGPEVSRARRAVESARFDLADTERKLAETKTLLDRGLVARTEYDGMLQQLRTQRTAVATANEDMRVALERGNGPNRRVAMLELANARARLAVLNAQFTGAVIRAKDAGIMVRPPANKLAVAAENDVHVGARVSRGQLIGVNARAGDLIVTFNIEEADVALLRLGQRLMVTGAGFAGLALPGKIDAIAGEASNPGGVATPGKAIFTATASLDPLAPDQAARVRVGMTANIAVMTYNAAAALVVPPSAVRGAVPDAFILVRNQRTGKDSLAKVQIGQVGPDGVEIVSGLKPGDTIVWEDAQSFPSQ